MGRYLLAAEALPLQSGNAYSEEIIKSWKKKRTIRTLTKKEHYKAVYLANRVAELEDQVDDLQFKLNRIKNNPIWKASGPARKCMHFVIRQKDRLKNCGSLSGVIAKVRYKSWEKKAMTHYGTRSFPSAEERQKQEAAVFERMPKISILFRCGTRRKAF